MEVGRGWCGGREGGRGWYEGREEGGGMEGGRKGVVWREGGGGVKGGRGVVWSGGGSKEHLIYSQWTIVQGNMAFSFPSKTPHEIP